MLKRTFDVFLSSIAIFFLSPVILCIYILVKFQLGSPVFFKQTRPGKNGVSFQMVKFRSMLDAMDQQGKPLPDELRLTSFGRKLRASSLDELPELWNVLKGDMSLVGPRPLLIEYLSIYTSEQAKRHDIRPGITGWAQINGRNAISWEEKFELDIWYVENHSLFLDIKILFLTVLRVFRRDGINAEGEATVSKFVGSRSDSSD